MKRILLMLNVVMLIVMPVGCASMTSADELKSDKPRDVVTSLPSDERVELVNGNTGFAIDLYRQLLDENQNLFFSPYSISAALAMVYAGARGETEAEMYRGMRFRLPSERLHPGFNYLDQQLNSRGQGAEGKDGYPFRLNVVNAIWGQKDHPFSSDYLDLLARNYGAGLRVLDFQSSPDESRETINAWVEEQTERRIKDLLPQGAVDSLTRLVLTNAVYFNAAWASQFEKNATIEDRFHTLNGTEVTVSMMRQTAHFGYNRADGFVALELPYDGNELSMVVLLPDEGRFRSFEQDIDGEGLNNAVAGLEWTRVRLAMPKFTIESSLGLNGALQALGIEAAFNPALADLSGIDGTRDLFITDVVHKAFVEVDEAGTEAAAATAVIVCDTGMPLDPVEVTLDRPFLFLIRDIETGSIVFFGRVMNPAA